MAFHFQGRKLDDVVRELSERKLDELFELDEIAYYLLAAAVSHKYTSLPHRGMGQSVDENLANEPGERCVAVFKSEDALYIAANNIWKTREMSNQPARFLQGLQIREGEKDDIQKSLRSPPLALFKDDAEVAEFKFDFASALVREYGFRKIIFLDTDMRYHNTKFHAEMQLLCRMLDRDIVPDSAYVGVSKPCCQFCEKRLALAGLKFANNHTVRGDDPNDRLFGLPHLDVEQLRSFKRLVGWEDATSSKMRAKGRARK
jgi:hypothetical protein